MFAYDKPTNIIISGDIHINLRKFPEFERKRVLMLAEEFKTLEADEDEELLFILNGDIFDKAKPTYEEIALFYEFIDVISHNGKRSVYVLSGNHEELGKEKTIFDYLPQHNFIYLKVGIFTFFEGSVSLFAVGHPFLDVIENKTLPLGDHTNVLVSHYRSNIGFAGEEINNKEVSETFDLTVLSDIHMAWCPYDNICYTSSPYAIHFDDYSTQYGYMHLYVWKRGVTETRQILFLPSKYKIKVSEEDFPYVLEEIADNEDNLYKLICKFPEDSSKLEQISSLPNIVHYEFVPDEEEDETAEYTEIIDSLKEGKDSDLAQIIDELVKAKEPSVKSYKKELETLL